MNGTRVFDNGERRICRSDTGFVASEFGCWIPGVYATQEAAMAAFDLDDHVLHGIQSRVNDAEPDRRRRVITLDMIRAEATS